MYEFKFDRLEETQCRLDYGIREIENAIRRNGTCNIRQRIYDPHIGELT